MPDYPTPEESLARLHAAGWSVGDVGCGKSWLVTGTNGENRIHAVGRTPAEAWYRACEQAEATGMLRRKADG